MIQGKIDFLNFYQEMNGIFAFFYKKLQVLINYVVNTYNLQLGYTRY